MPTFLSDAWIETFNDAVATAPVEPPPDAGLVATEGRFCVLQVVQDDPEGDRAILMEYADGALRLRALEPGLDDLTSDVTVRMAWDDALAMATGTLAVADALAEGRIKVRGDLAVLVAGQRLLEQLQPRLAGLSPGDAAA
jgi:hypothetical protein